MNDYFDLFFDPSRWTAFRQHCRESLKQAASSPDAAETLLEALESASRKALDPSLNGNWPQWLDVLRELPQRPFAVTSTASGPVVEIGLQEQLEPADRESLCRQLMALKPWRKGPFSVFGIAIDSEWRCNLKWDRLAPFLDSFPGAPPEKPLQGRRILDIGCSNGYYGFRMQAAGAHVVIGLEPFLIYGVQFIALNHFLHSNTVALFPVGIEALPKRLAWFDTVFSMGVLYHRRDPLEHLQVIREALCAGGQMILETLVVTDLESLGTETVRDGVLTPSSRYAKMRNVFAIPTPAKLMEWVEEAGFEDIRMVSACPTLFAEQRATDWSCDQSLEAFLDPSNPRRTVEGLPAPVRAVVTARKTSN